jgi:hypothetical protein
MASSLRVVLLAPILFALPAHAQSAAEFPVPASATPAPAPPAPAPAAAANGAPNAEPAAPAAVNGAPSVDELSRRGSAAASQQPLPQTSAAPLSQPLPPPVGQAPSDNVGEHSEWYGWQILTTDGVALTFLVLGAAASNSARGSSGELFALSSLGTYVAGGPIIHALHGNWGRSAASLGLRVGAPIVGGLVGATMEDCSGGDFCGLAGGLVGATLGVTTAIVVDAAALAHETVSDEPAVVPVLRTGKNGTWLGVSGRF